MTRGIAVFLCCLSTVVLAQEKQTITIHHLWNNKSITLNEKYLFQNQDSISIQTLKYYISNIQFLNKQKIVWKERKSYHLIDEEKVNSKKIFLPHLPTSIEFDAIQFNIGIDSATNYAGVGEGDLDPTNGMYWTWQNGYINLKLEGESSICKTKNNAFQFHIGGYENGFATIQKLNFKVNKNHNLNIKVDLEKWVSQLNLASQNTIMQPCKEAVDITNKLPSMLNNE